jgi:hypothetical protein
MRLTHYLLSFGHKGLHRLAQTDNKASALIPHDRAAYDLPLPLDEICKDTAPFIRSYLLDHDLFSSLSRNSTESPYINFLIVFIGVNLPRSPINMHDYIALQLAEMLSYRRDHSLFQVGKDGLLVDILVAGNAIDNSEQFLTHLGFIPNPNWCWTKKSGNFFSFHFNNSQAKPSL